MKLHLLGEQCIVYWVVMLSNSDPHKRKRRGRLRAWAIKLAREQRDHAWGPVQRGFWDQTVSGVRQSLTRARPPAHVETFEAAVSRLGLTQKQLAEQLQNYKAVHLLLYAFAGVLVVYGTHLALSRGLLVGACAYVASCAAVVYGYLHGFRAWQIEHRNLIRLQDAVRIPGTYLVL